MFVYNAYSTVRAANIAKGIDKNKWEEVEDFVDIFKFFKFPTHDALRFIVARTLISKGGFEYKMLISNIPFKADVCNRNVSFLQLKADH